MSSGPISALGRVVQEPNGAYLPNAIQTSAPINPGNSGGALVTLDGSVVGIPTLEAADPQNNAGGAAQGIGFAVPSTRVIFVARQIITTGRVAHTGRAYLGVVAVDASSARGIPFPLPGFGAIPNVQGALVQQVAPGGPADRAGVRQGDVIPRSASHSTTSARLKRKRTYQRTAAATMSSGNVRWEKALVERAVKRRLQAEQRHR